MKKLFLKPKSLIVFEGPDRTGKTTQLKQFASIAWVQSPLCTHQPSGQSELGRQIYGLTEQFVNIPPLSRQLLHLAAHAEHYEYSVLPTLENNRSVIMDRCWISTLVYGMAEKSIQEAVKYHDFMNLCQMPARRIMPTLVFYFRKPFVEDFHNTQRLFEEYENFFRNYCSVPYEYMEKGGVRGVRETTDYILEILKKRELLWEIDV